MNDDDLPLVAERAMNTVLRYHDEGHTQVAPLDQMMPGIDSRHLRIMKDRIAEVLHLRANAADRNAANVELVCDAAIAGLDLYNEEHHDKPVNEQWMYLCVQSLAVLELMPDMVRGAPPRLPRPNALGPGEAGPATSTTTSDGPEAGMGDRKTPEHDGADDQSPSGSRATTAFESPLPPTPTPALKRDISTLGDPSSAVDSDDQAEPVSSAPRAKKRRSNGPQVANGKEAWGDEEITKLIKWKAQGKTHKEIGVILGRTEPACAIRHSIVLRQDKWSNFAREYREKRAAGEASDEEGEPAIKGEPANEDDPAKEGEQIAPAEDEQMD